MLEQLLPNVFWPEIWQASLDTLNMLLGSMLFTVLLGLPLGVLLFLTSPRQMFEQKAFYGLLSLLVNKKYLRVCRAICIMNTENNR